MKIDIVGAGMAGLALAWHLLRYPETEVSLFDPHGIGGGASGIAAGLLHPYVGKRALLSSYGKEAMQEARDLLALAEEGEKEAICLRTGLFRPAVTEEQKRDFQACVEAHPLSAFWESRLEGVLPGLWIPEAITVFSRRFLQALWKKCEKRGAKFFPQEWEERGRLVVFATGAETVRRFPDLPLKTNKGQLLVCRWSEPLSFSIASEGHISPTEESSLCQVGSTYEHGVLDSAPDPLAALPLLGKVAKFYPKAAEFSVVEVRAGWRAAPLQGHLPLTVQAAPKAWVFSGLGSRGLLYASWCAKQLAEKIVGS